MEDSIAKFCKTLACFCNHIHGSSDALKQSIERRPVPLDSASSTFIQCLNRRVCSAASDLNLLESMSFGTVSFEELLGHCNEVFKKNEFDMFELEDRLKSFGYSSEVEIHEEDEEQVWEYSPPWTGLGMKRVDEDPSFEDSMSLQNLGLSDASLATIASEADLEMEINGSNLPSTMTLEPTEGSKPFIRVVKDDYENLPSFMKSLAPFEDLVIAAEKINLRLSEKSNDFLHKDEIASLDLGNNERLYLVLLVRMKQLIIEKIDGLISYRVLN